jgi:ZIP family zinc transporter
MILRNKGTYAQAFKWLLIDALAPALGILSTLFITLGEGELALVLALFTGFFLYIGASDLLPESHHGHTKIIPSVMTILGAGFVYLVIQLAS